MDSIRITVSARLARRQFWLPDQHASTGTYYGAQTSDIACADRFAVTCAQADCVTHGCTDYSPCDDSGSHGI